MPIPISGFFCWPPVSHPGRQWSRLSVKHTLAALAAIAPTAAAVRSAKRPHSVFLLTRPTPLDLAKI
ncbi:MAG: hypothetical protein Q8S73_32150 [Deltaproteobacteria bacterium]|nr:hypothetical protein [Deltaproteobacteria bacterium]